MKIVAANHADCLRRPGTASSHRDTPEAILLDTVGDDLRALYRDDAADLPDALVALAMRLDARRLPEALAA